jgi:S1-C subfamily serine protease
MNFFPMFRSLRPFIVAAGAMTFCLLGGGCLHLPTSAERSASFSAYARARIGGEQAGDYIIARSRFVFSGPNPSPTAGQPDVADLEGKQAEAGTATAIDPRGYFLTAGHCVGDKPLFLLIISQEAGYVIPVRVVWRGQEGQLDLAILKVRESPGLAPKYFEWARDFKPGDAVLAAGVSYDTDTRKFNGFIEPFAGRILSVSALKGSSPPGQTILHDSPGRPGDSGGPLVTPDGRLVGITVGASGAFEFPYWIHKSVPLQIPFQRVAARALRPDLDWLRRTIDDDFAAHSSTGDAKAP